VSNTLKKGEGSPGRFSKVTYTALLAFKKAIDHQNRIWRNYKPSSALLASFQKLSALQSKELLISIKY
jgi:hypothetical protein